MYELVSTSPRVLTIIQHFCPRCTMYALHTLYMVQQFYIRKSVRNGIFLAKYFDIYVDVDNCKSSSMIDPPNNQTSISFLLVLLLLLLLLVIVTSHIVGFRIREKLPKTLQRKGKYKNISVIQFIKSNNA